MATEHVELGKIKKPVENKVSPLSETSLDEPIELEPNKLVEIYSDMGRTRTGIQNSEYVWSDRTFGMKHHPNGKPLDTGK
jgi:hypothetical protein